MNVYITKTANPQVLLFLSPKSSSSERVYITKTSLFSHCHLSRQSQSLLGIAILVQVVKRLRGLSCLFGTARFLFRSSRAVCWSRFTSPLAICLGKPSFFESVQKLHARIGRKVTWIFF